MRMHPYEELYLLLGSEGTEILIHAVLNKFVKMMAEDKKFNEFVHQRVNQQRGESEDKEEHRRIDSYIFSPYELENEEIVERAVHELRKNAFDFLLRSGFFEYDKEYIVKMTEEWSRFDLYGVSHEEDYKGKDNRVKIEVTIQEI